MKVLVDENLDEDFPEFLPEHDARHVTALGWKGAKNGHLLSLAEEAAFEAIISCDKNFPHQQRFKRRSLFLIVLDIHPNVLMNQVACLDAIRDRLESGVAGNVYVIPGPHSRRPASEGD